MDAGSYADAPFSPDEDPAQRRQTSISQQRSPFADFTRDRFPSIGGWNSNSQIITQPRDRGSIAIPPDQLGPPQPASARSSRSRWVNQIVVLSEKTKTPAETEETAKLLDTTNMDPYYEYVHRQCTILPEKTKTVEILKIASKAYVLAFSGAMKLLPQRKKDDSSLPGKTQEELEAFVHEKSREKWPERGNVDSLVLFWTVLLLHVAYLHDMRLYTRQEFLIKAELDLVDRFTKYQESLLDPYEYEWVQSFHIAATFARLYEISFGNGTEALPSNLVSYLNQDWHTTTPRTRYTAVMIESLQAGLVSLPKSRAVLTHEVSKLLQANARLQDISMRTWLLATGVSREAGWVAESAAFMSLSSVRVVTPGFPSSIIAQILELVTAIRVTALSQNDDQYLFNPISFHAVSLATVTLIELQACHLDQSNGQGMVDAATSEMVKQLEEFVKRRNELDGGAGGVFWAKSLIELVKESAHPMDERTEEEITPGMVWILEDGYLQSVMSMNPK